jgi:hypothetical protein
VHAQQIMIFIKQSTFEHAPGLHTANGGLQKLVKGKR